MYSSRVEEEAHRRVESMMPTMEMVMERTRDVMKRERDVKQKEGRLRKLAKEMLELRNQLKRKEKDNMAYRRDLNAHKTVLRRFKARSIEAQRTISRLAKREKELTDEHARDEEIERFKQKILSRDAQIRYLRNRIKELEAFGSLLSAENDENDEDSSKEGEETKEEEEETKQIPSRKDILEELNVTIADESLSADERRQILAEALQRSAQAERARCRKIFENVRARSAQKTVAEGKTNEENEDEEEEDAVSTILKRLDRSVVTHRRWLEDFDKEFRKDKEDDEKVEDSLERARALEITQMEMVRKLRDYIDEKKLEERKKKEEEVAEGQRREEESMVWKERSSELEKALEYEKERVHERLVKTLERLDRLRNRHGK